MNLAREFAFNLLVNLILQIGILALAAAALTPALTRMRASLQHRVFLGLFAACLAAPVANTIWTPAQATPRTIQVRDQASIASSSSFPRGANPNPGHLFLAWYSKVSGGHQLRSVELHFTALTVWAALIGIGFVRFAASVLAVHRLRREATPLSPQMLTVLGQIPLFASAALQHPVTIGIVRPAILLPAAMLDRLDPGDFNVIITHECAHIRRKDVLLHSLCQLISIPLFWHPGIRYLSSHVSQTRELACDQEAASVLKSRRAYAQSLLRLASLCLTSKYPEPSRPQLTALGIFNHDNLEARILMLTRKTRSLPRARLAALALTATLTFGAGIALARAATIQSSSQPSTEATRFAGTWHWIFNGNSFSTMILNWNGSTMTGSVTESKIALNDEGGLSRADPSDDGAVALIRRAWFDGSALHITVTDGPNPLEFIVTLKDDTHADIHPVGAPPKMKPIRAEKIP